MPLKREQKQKIIEDLKEKIKLQKAIVYVAIEGLKAKEIFDLREKLKREESLLVVVKKTLLNIAFKEKGIPINEKELSGQVALVFGFKDEISPAKITYEFSLINQNLKILGGFVENKIREIEEIIKLAKISSKEELLAKVVWSLQAPIANFVNVLQGNIKGLILALNAISKSK